MSLFLVCSFVFHMVFLFLYLTYFTYPSNEYSRLISFRMDKLDFLAVQGILKNLIQHHKLKASILWCSAFFMVQLSHPYMTTGKTIALTRQTFVSQVMSQLFNTLSRFVIAFLRRSKYSFEDAGPPNSQMVSEPGKNVTLTCQPKEKCLLEEVSWEKIQPQQIDVLISCNLSHGRSYTSKYPRQILSNCSHGMKKTFITIPNVTGSDSGLYRCGFKASTGEKETFVMRLTVTDGERRRQQQRGPFKDFWITQNRAANNYRNTFPANPPSDGAGEDIYVNHPTFSRVPRARV
ncbi:hypothetical protein FD755_010128 [Muntiacus reevesi]|uniref:Ig-like domain-containing protein n=1 Tax=Muntiacus reevesi TaxID=9886 RepID=A0A5N3XX96_MUNRE|nr:hypothetical protein FD755_010128 [Muntiacus reevesi]